MLEPISTDATGPLEGTWRVAPPYPLDSIPLVAPPKVAEFPAHSGSEFEVSHGRAMLPSWLVSLIVHMSILIALGTMFHFAPRGGGRHLDKMLGLSLDPVERGDPNGAGTDVTAEKPSTGGTDTPGPRPAGAGQGDAASVFPQQAPLDPSDALPGSTHFAGGGLAGGGLPGVGGMTEGGRPSTGPRKGGATTGVFGVTGQGFKFVYVFDRSGSMGGSGRTPLAAAKDELLASLESLDDIHQFQIVFYNETPLVFPLAGQAGRLVFGTKQNKARAREFVNSVTADGATRHEEALELALRMQPDVIFFLTDADQPVLTPFQLSNIRNRNAGRSAINTVEFGLGPQLGGRNFLIDLAQQNGGQHVYVDIARLNK